MLRLSANRWWAFVLTLCLLTTCFFLITVQSPSVARAGSGSCYLPTDDPPSDSPSLGDPDVPMGPGDGKTSKFVVADRLIGFHIHDVKYPGQDHCAPGTGTVDFAALKPLVKPEHIKVFELSPSLTAEEVLAGVAHVKAIWGPE